MSEADIQAGILLSQSRNATRLFRNNTGAAWQGVRDPNSTRALLILRNPRPVNFGLHIGSPDLVGWRTVKIEPHHVGRNLAVFVGLEVKTPTGRTSADQDTFLAAMARAGCLGGVARDDTDAERLLRFA